MRRRARIALALALVAAAALPAVGRAQGAAPACAAGDPAAEARLLGAYSDAGAYPASQRDRSGAIPASVSVDVPPIAFTGPGSTPTLPYGPCQHIYRYRFPSIRAPHGAAPAPFRYVEVDWNTEGLPRGPNGSFTSPHFDFHFYLRPRAWIDAHTMCETSNGKTCDPSKTGYAQMRRFLELPPANLVPRLYRPDVGSSIPLMGLHLLDMAFQYTVDRVDHHPTLIYGTFDGQLIFAEASVTLLTLQDAIAAPGHAVAFRFRQPPDVRAQVAWPTRFVVRALPGGGFRAGFEGFRLMRPRGSR